ncbi:MAG: hypothetical protein OH335_04845 [Candidatus Parvarchaeota archaeon]|nr:hypothetical protein [Candidatus Jingweiarchaeum tengchongense]MCW1306074.1 hypothetical protein [Candidatus Jingweiarchaeum tengchongense]
MDLKFLIVYYVLAIIVFPFVFVIDIAMTMKDVIDGWLRKKHRKQRRK